MTWLVTGGAGYIGSHIAHALQASGREVVVLDDLSSGHAHRVPSSVPLVFASVLDETTLVDTIQRYRVTGVVHLAGKKRADESILRPRYYYEQNVLGMECLLRSMRLSKVSRLVFSSSCAVYGDVAGEAITELAATIPVSPYGHTKLMGEKMVRGAGKECGMNWISLRYFNVAGSGNSNLADAAEFNLIPMTFRALRDGRAPRIFGDDYPTADGTCIRDYIHVSDVVSAHVAAAERLERGDAGAIYNVGRGHGFSVREIMDLIAEVTGQCFHPRVVGRRAGDPACVIASASLIASELGWAARLGMHEIVSSAWCGWNRHHPRFEPARDAASAASATPGRRCASSR